MKTDLLRGKIQEFIADSEKELDRFNKDAKERQDILDQYKLLTRETILNMTEDDIYQYLSKLWAMSTWGNKHYRVNKTITDNGLENLRQNLAQLLRGKGDIAERWDTFRSKIKGMGPAMVSEILCKAHPDEFMIWNRRTWVALNYLGVKHLPRHDYQVTGKAYEHLCEVCKEIGEELAKAGFKDTSLLSVDYFLWDKLQVQDSLSSIFGRKPEKPEEPKPESAKEAAFIHNDIRDKLSDIGQWLGFMASTEQNVADGARVDTLWEATIGNMGRVIYVFEVQTGGTIDSLLMNLLKCLNNSAVQGVVAVSDQKQLERIKREVSSVKDLRDKLRYWDYEEVIKIHEALAYVNDRINNLRLVPEGFRS
jgi:hypothetical protein